MNLLKNLSVFVYPVGPEDRTGAPLRETFSVLSVGFTSRRPVYLG